MANDIMLHPVYKHLRKQLKKNYNSQYKNIFIILYSFIFYNLGIKIDIEKFNSIQSIYYWEKKFINKTLKPKKINPKMSGKKFSETSLYFNTYLLKAIPCP